MEKPLSSPPEPPLSANTNGHHENDDKGHHGDISNPDNNAEQGKVSVRPKKEGKLGRAGEGNITDISSSNECSIVIR